MCSLYTRFVAADDIPGWQAIKRGDTPLTWDLWSSQVERSNTLTEAGKHAVRKAVDAIAEYLGDGWLDKFLPRGSSPSPNAGLPLMSLQWWPSNDVPHVFARILELGLRLSLFKGKPGLGDVRKIMQNDLGQFAHSLLQFEVGALALRAGWDVVFEPKVTAHGDRRTDLHLSRNGDSMLVEAKGFLLDKTTTEDLQFSDRIKMEIQAIEMKEGVTFDGSIEPSIDEVALADCLGKLKALAVDAARTGLRLEITTPSGQRLAVLPGWPSAEGTLSITIRHGDEWQRIVTAIKDKSNQGRGGDPLWLRFDETSLFWALFLPPDWPRHYIHEQLARDLAATLMPFDHVAGLVLSRQPAVGSSGGTDNTYHPLDGNATGLTRTTQAPFWRESLIVPGLHPSAQRHLAEWSRWYGDEAGWLPWALDQHRQPPLAELFRTPR